MSTQVTSLINAIEAELKALSYSVSKTPLEESAGLDAERKAWIENPSTKEYEAYSQHYWDTETITISIAERRSTHNHSAALKELGDRRDDIRKHLTNQDFHSRLPTILKKATFIGHESAVGEGAITSVMTFEYVIGRLLT